MSRMVSVLIIIGLGAVVAILKLGFNQSLPAFWILLVLAVAALAIVNELT